MAGRTRSRKNSAQRRATLFGFTALGQLLERIRPCRLEQPPATGKCRFIQRHERLGGKICDLIKDNERGVTLVAHHGVCCLERETCGENTQSAQQAPFRLG
jgi:hypothetical protein